MNNKLLLQRQWIAYIDDERNIDNGIIVVLSEGYYFKVDPGCGVRGFDSMAEVRQETRKKDVYKQVTNRNLRS